MVAWLRDKRKSVAGLIRKRPESDPLAKAIKRLRKKGVDNCFDSYLVNEKVLAAIDAVCA